MSRAQDLLAALAERGISVAVQDGQLRVRPRSALSPALIARILECKSELLATIGASRQAAEPPARALTTSRRPAAPAERDPRCTRQPPALAQPPPRPSPSGQKPAERWLLWTLAAEPGLSRADLRTRVEHAVALLLERGEIRCRADGGLTLNSQ